MAHVQIKTHADGRVVQFDIDGVDMTKKTYAHGFGIDFPEELGRPVQVRMFIAADVLDLDLPEAVLEAVRRSDAEVEASMAAGADAEVER